MDRDGSRSEETEETKELGETREMGEIERGWMRARDREK